MVGEGQYSTLTLDSKGSVAYLWIDRAPQNVLNFAFFDELSEVVDGVLPNLDADGLVMCGRGRHFSSGSDIQELYAEVGNESSPLWCESHSQSLQKLRDLPYPVLAAIQGCCLGSAVELALACDVRIATTNAMIAFPETQHGLIPGCGGTVALTETVGYQNALDLILTGRALDAEQALSIGLVDRVVSKKELLGNCERLISCKKGLISVNR